MKSRMIGIVFAALLGGFVIGGLVTIKVVRPDAAPVAASEPVLATTPSSAFSGKTYSYYKAHVAEAKARWHDCSEHGVNPMSDSPDARDCEVAREVSLQSR
jgi:hypothetical protein